MKKIILISILAILSLKTVAQANTDEYKDYKPCNQCSTEKWKNSRSSGTTYNSSQSNSGLKNVVGSEIKTGTRKIVVFCVSIVSTIAGVIIYKKIDNEINHIQ